MVPSRPQPASGRPDTVLSVHLQTGTATQAANRADTQKTRIAAPSLLHGGMTRRRRAATGPASDGEAGKQGHLAAGHARRLAHHVRRGGRGRSRPTRSRRRDQRLRGRMTHPPLIGFALSRVDRRIQLSGCPALRSMVTPADANRHRGGVVGKRFDHAAVADRAAGALLGHALELALEHCQPGEPPLDLLELAPRKPINGVAWLVRARAAAPARSLSGTAVNACRRRHHGAGHGSWDCG